MSTLETITLPGTPSTDRLAPEFRDTAAAYRIDLTDGRSLLLRLDHGRLELHEGREPADSVLSCTPDDFQRLLLGELNLLAAFMRGNVTIRGDLAAAKRLYRYLRLVNSREEKP